MRYKILVIVTALCASGIAWGAGSNDLSSRIDAVFSEYDAADVPGCAVGVIQDGSYVHARGYGSANLEHGIPISRESVFRIGSVSKQFTAAAIAILASRGELDLDADVRDYLPDLREYKSTVTVRQMVHHISGMGEYEGKTVYEVAPGKAFRFGNEDYWTIAEFYEQVRAAPLVLEPGERFEYSNIAYFLLSQVVERVSGQSLREFAKAEIFEPLGMQATFFNDNVDGIVPNRADGYTPLEEGGFEILMTNLDWVGDGSVYTTLNDFIKWDQAIALGKMPGGMAVQKLMLEPHPVTVTTMPGDLLDAGAGYAFGLEIGKYKGHAVILHTGSWVGFRALYARFPEQETSAIVMCNRADAAEDGDKRTQLLEVVVSDFPESGQADTPKARGAELLAPFKSELKAALIAGMQQGPVNAINVCKDEAPGIAESLMTDDVRMGRTSHRLRNPANTAPGWTAAILADYLLHPDARKSQVVALAKGREGYVEPIVMQPLCLACHGASIAPEIAARLEDAYPVDSATGFEVDDLRGLFWVEYATEANQPD